MDACFPYDVEEELGEIQFFTNECPGVYFLPCRQDSNFRNEFYAVEDTAQAIPSRVKRMGRRLDSCPGLLVYRVEDLSGGQKIVKY